jgi:hypothetical protein
MALTNQTNYKQLSDGKGTVLGQSSTDTVGFYGLATPIARPSAGTAITTGATETATIALVKQLRASLVALGLIG